MDAYEFLANMCFGPYLCRKVSVDYTVSEHDEIELMSVWTMRDLDGDEMIGEDWTNYLTDDGRDYFQQLCEQDWNDRKQDEAEAYADRHAYIND